jgi:DNA-binding transcriptional MerR regulator
MEKSRDAFRTISEVADLLGTPAHVLRFWESRFPQIRPVKRAGGRRYYRPSDVALLSGIKRLLHGDGLTIRGVQKVLRENGVRHVMALAEEPIARDAREQTQTGDEDRLVAGVLAFPDAAAGPGPPRAEAQPPWSTTPPAAKDPVRPQSAGSAPDSADALLLTGAQRIGPSGASGIDPDHRRTQTAGAPADMESMTDDPGLAGVIAVGLRALHGAGVQQDRRAPLAAAALRLRDLRARLAAAAGAS